MKCDEVRELMPDLAAGLAGVTPQLEEKLSQHLENCMACAGKLEEFRQTMALLDEWKAPEPSPYFDIRLQARLREEMSKPQAGWLAWFRRPVLAAALTVLMGIGIGLFLTNDGERYTPSKNVVAVVEPPPQAEPGTAVSDLQSLENKHDLYSDFYLLDDFQVQHDVNANP